MNMTSRERIWSSLNHKEPDRVPVDLGGSIVTSICKEAYQDLMNYLGFDIIKENIKMFDIVQQLPELDQRLLDWVNVDVIPLVTNPPSTWELNIKDEGSYWSYKDEWGATLHMPKSSYYFDYVEFPIQESTEKTLQEMNWPDPDDPARMYGIKEKAKYLYENTDYAIIGSPIFGGGIFEHPARIRGMEDFLMDSVANVKFADAIIEKITELYLKATENFLDEVGEYIQVFAYWDDISSQNGPMISPEFYRQHIKPRQKKIFDLVHKKSTAKVFYHCCGSAYNFIPDFIEIGADILNPVQVSAANMDNTAQLKREFGKDIVFWGGGIDTQSTLPFGSTDKIRDEVKRRLDDLAPGGGFVFNPVHNIQNLVPPENIVEMFNTLKENWNY
jgi:uroporphyrinogen decarboxylase